MPRFVILEHDHPSLHWDLMFEADGVLKTWRLPAPPTQQPTTAMSLGDHRLAYLDYEGPLSGDRGTVKRWDAGEYETMQQSQDAWTVAVKGTRWRGTMQLRQRDGSAWTIDCTAGEA